jgi:hypothetical protein
MSKRVEYDRLIEQAKVIVHSKETIISSLQRNQDMVDRENTDLKEQIHQLQQIIVQLNQGNVEIAKEAMISPAFAAKKKSLKIDENNITFKTINKNLDDY